MKEYLLFLFIIISNNCLGQSLVLNWANQFESVQKTYVESSILGDSNNIYTVGEFVGKVDFDPSFDTLYLVSTGIFGGSTFITKQDSSGKLKWAKKIGDIEGAAYSIAKDQNENVYITGSFKGNPDVDPGPGVFTLHSNGLEDIYILKLDKNGQFIWAKSIGGSTSNEWANDIEIDHKGNVIVCGIFFNTIDFDPSLGVFNLTSNGIGDAFILKLDSDGNFIWAKGIGGKDSDYAKAIDIDVNDNIYMIGQFADSADLDPSTKKFQVISKGGYDVFVLKTDSSGEFVWAKSIGGIKTDQAEDIKVDKEDQVVFVAQNMDVVDLDPGPGTSIEICKGHCAASAIKLDSLGNYIWGKFFTGNGSIRPYCMDIDQQNNIYISGIFSDSIDFNPNKDTFYQKSLGYSTPIIKLSPSGELVYAFQLGSNKSSYAKGIHSNNNKNIYITGTFLENCDFDPNASTYILKSFGLQDGYISKFKEEQISNIPEFRTEKFEIFPNPNSGIFTIDLKYENIDKIEIYTLMGTLIFKAENKTNLFIIDISELFPGVYVLKLFKDNQLFQTEKVLKN